MHRLAALWDEAEQGDGRALPLHLAAALDDPAWNDADRAWALAWLLGRREPRLLQAKALRALAVAVTGQPQWMIDECLAAGADAAELIAHAMPPPVEPMHLQPAVAAALLHAWRALPAVQREAALKTELAHWPAPTRLMLLRLIAGTTRPPMPMAELREGLARRAGCTPERMALRLDALVEGRARPDATGWAGLMLGDAAAGASGDAASEGAQLPLTWPAPHPIDAPPRDGGPWIARRSTGGQRVQLCRHAAGVRIWSARGELLERLHPALASAAEACPIGTVLTGEISGGRLWADDLLMVAAHDLRVEPPMQRQHRLQRLAAELAWGPESAMAVVEPLRLHGTEALVAHHAALRRDGARGLLLAPADAAPDAPRLYWPAAPQSLRAVLVYAEAQRSGPPACELALWSRCPADAEEAHACAQAIGSGRPPAAPALRLLPLARTSLGLNRDDRARLEGIVAATTFQRFGPVAALRPSVVIELAFDALVPDARRRGGLAAVAPRLLRLREDLPIEAADSVHEARMLMVPSD